MHYKYLKLLTITLFCLGLTKCHPDSMAATTGWVADDSLASVGNNLESNNKIGFTALPSGDRLEDGNFYDLGHIGNWWSSTEGGPAFVQGLTGIVVNLPGARFRNIYHDYYYVNNYVNNKKYGMSVRCLKDNKTKKEG